MNETEGKNILSNIFIHQFVEDATLFNMIDTEESISKLSCLLQVLYERVENNISKKHNFRVAKILESEDSYDVKKSALAFALHIQADLGEFIYCLRLFNEKLSMINLESKWEDVMDSSEMLCLAAVIIDVNIQLEEDIFKYVDKLKLKIFLLKVCALKMSKHVSLDKSSLFFKYFAYISSRDPKFIDETLQYFVEQENFDFLCLLFDKKLRYLVTCEYFKQDNFWNHMKIHIVSNDTVRKKQVQYILWRTIDYYKTNCMLLPDVLQTGTFQDWDFFFILLEMSKEKQLHLIQPTLKLLPSIKELHMSWRSCLYQELLNHSQLIVVYNIVKHILKLKFSCDEIHRKILHDCLLALNKFEYSNLSKDVFCQLRIFCDELTEDCYIIFFEEFLRIDWNPAAAWCVLTGSSAILGKIPHHLIIKMLLCLKKLPHTYIKQSCIIFFIEKFLNESSNLFENLMLVGKFLLSTHHQVDKEVFYRIIEQKKSELEKYNEELEKSITRSVEEMDSDCLVLSLELMKKLNMEIKNDLPIPHSSLGDIILFYYPGLIKPSDLQNYLMERFQNVDSTDDQFLFKLLEMLFDKDSMNILSSEKSLTLWNSTGTDKTKRFFASYLLFRTAGLDTSTDSVITERAEIYLKHSKYDFGALWMKRWRKSVEKEQDEEQMSEMLKTLLELLDSDDEKKLEIVVCNLDLVVKYASLWKDKVIQILDLCLRKLCTLPNNLMRKYSAMFFYSIFQGDLFSIPAFAECWEKWYSELFHFYFFDCDYLLKIMLEGCRNIILQEALFVQTLVPFILGALTKGTVIQKNQRVEYGICQEIHDNVDLPFIQNPNIITSVSKMLSVECLYLIAKNKNTNHFPSADSLMKMLLERYMENYNKRYFPDSKIHFDKLRIVQAMLIIVNFIDISQDQLIQFILKSFCEESHQPSVKQLLQWLLIILVLKTPVYLRLMIEEVETANFSHPSTVLTLIPVMYHLVTYLGDEVYWNEFTDALIPLIMGANFKLRVYAQIILRNIIQKAKNAQLLEFIDKYSFLEKSISSVLDATGNAVSETLKQDIIFIENFDPVLHYSVETIFVTLPKILDVPPSEWENVLEHRFSEKFDIKIEAVNKLPNIPHRKIDDHKNEDEFFCVNVQKKIIPWKQDLEEKIDNNCLNSLICVASLVEKSSNIGGLSRTCEIFNVQQLVLHNIKIKDDKEFKNLSMSSENWVDFMEVKRDDLSNFLTELRQQGYSIVGLEQTSESVKLDKFKFEKKTVILLGNEKGGIPAPLLPLLDTCVEIPQFGQTRSLNVHVAGATFIWEYVKQHML